MHKCKTADIHCDLSPFTILYRLVHSKTIINGIASINIVKPSPTVHGPEGLILFIRDITAIVMM